MPEVLCASPGDNVRALESITLSGLSQQRGEATPPDLHLLLLLLTGVQQRNESVPQ